MVGAGASLAEARARRRTWVKHHPPLDANFFRRVKKYRPGALYDRVQAQAARLGVADLARANPAVGLEDYLGRLYFNVHHNPRAVSVRAYFDLIDLYADEVVETTNWMVGTKGLFVRMLQRELLRGNRITVLTFNIDLVIENALQQLAHHVQVRLGGFGTPTASPPLYARPPCQATVFSSWAPDPQRSGFTSCTGR